MHKLPIVTYKFITPNTQKFNQGELKNSYGFYHDGDFGKYLENEKEHPVNEDRAYNSFGDYLSDHWTKETSGDREHIQTFTNLPDNSLKMADKTIIFTGVISLPEDISDLGGFGDNETKQKICDYYFNQLIKHHHFDKKDWCYFAAEHTNTKHTHLHVMVFQPANVTGEKVMDYKVKSNCMTSRWVRTNTIRYVRSVIKTMNNDLVQELLDTKHIMQKDFRTEITKQEYSNKLKELANAIQEVKGNKGRLQYKQLIHYSKLSNEEFKNIDKKEGAISPSNSRMLINRIDALSEFVIKNSPELSSYMDDINKITETMYPINTKDNNLNILNSIDREFNVSELKTNLGNCILNAVKNNVYLAISTLSKEGKQLRSENLKAAGIANKDCRLYKHTINDSIQKANNQIQGQFANLTKQAQNDITEKFSQWLLELEERYKQEIELGLR